MPRFLHISLLLLAIPLIVAPGVFAQDMERGESLPDVELPAPPEHFEWKHLSDIKAAFLLPDGWHFSKQTSGDTRAYFLTRQNIEDEGAFSTGLSINVVPDVKDKTGYPAPVYAQAFIAAAGPDTNEEVLKRARLGNEPMPGFGVRTRSQNDAGESVIVHRIAFGNTKTDTFYLISFESPEARWEEAWEKGGVMLTRFVLDEGV